MTYSRDTRFPLEWNEWRREWGRWLDAHSAQMTPAQKFPGKNFLADEVLGAWKVSGRTVELSEVTFPNLEERDPATGRLFDYHVRSIGMTFGIGVDAEGGVVHTFAELEQALGLQDPDEAE